MEYLDENYNLVYHKTDIEVPEGADFLASILDHVVFYKKGNPFFWWNGAEWCLCSDFVDEETFGHILWQRTPSANVVDNVNHPTHYASGSVECIDAIEASMSAEAFKGFLKGNVQKYMWRYEQKGGAESLEKAQWYLNMLLSRVGS